MFTSSPLKWLCSGALLVMGASGQAGAQTPGLPVLQNAFANPGLAFAANFGGGGGQSFYGAAVAWGLGGGRLQVSGAAGAQRSNEAARGAYGARLAATLWNSAGGGIGVGAFGGVGGAPRTRDGDVVTNPALVNIPLGLTASYRRNLGPTRGFSVYGSPLYRWSRVTTDDGSASDGAIRFALGIDVGVTPALGATLGTEFGSGSSSGGSNFGLAISWVPGRR
jgi:hypothetical protein